MSSHPRVPGVYISCYSMLALLGLKAGRYCPYGRKAFRYAIKINIFRQASQKNEFNAYLVHYQTTHIYHFQQSMPLYNYRLTPWQHTQDIAAHHSHHPTSSLQIKSSSIASLSSASEISPSVTPTTRNSVLRSWLTRPAQLTYILYTSPHVICSHLLRWASAVWTSLRTGLN